jgi:hypothetical protein
VRAFTQEHHPAYGAPVFYVCTQDLFQFPVPTLPLRES